MQALNAPDINQTLPPELIAAVFDFLPWSTLYSAKQACDQWLAITTALVPPPDSRLPADLLAHQALNNDDIYCLAWIAKYPRIAIRHVNEIIVDPLVRTLPSDRFETFAILIKTHFMDSKIDQDRLIRRRLFHSPAWLTSLSDERLRDQVASGAIYAAIGERRTGITKMILDAKQRYRAVRYAIRIGSLELVRELLDFRPDELKGFNFTPLAIELGQREIINYLIDTSRSEFCEYIIAKLGDLESDARIGARKRYHLAIAAKRGHFEFLKRHAGVDEFSNKYCQIVFAAARSGHSEMLEWILARNPGKNPEDVAYAVCQGAVKNNYPDLLMQYFSLIKPVLRIHFLSTACCSGSFAMIELLILLLPHPTSLEQDIVCSRISVNKGDTLARLQLLHKHGISVAGAGWVIRDRLNCPSNILPSILLDLKRAAAYIKSLAPSHT
jgi:hypothetical protein